MELPTMKKCLFLFLIGSALLFTPSVRGAVVIDDFEMGGIVKPPAPVVQRVVDDTGAYTRVAGAGEVQAGVHYGSDVEIRSSSGSITYDASPAGSGEMTVNFTAANGQSINFVWDGPPVAPFTDSDNNDFALNLLVADPADTGFILRLTALDPGIDATIRIVQGASSFALTKTLTSLSTFFSFAAIGFDPTAPVRSISLNVENNPPPSGISGARSLTLTNLASGVPEPASLLAWLGLSGAAGLAYLRRRKSTRS
jgi:hypothetical protein